jgi:hypothetical protein
MHDRETANLTATQDVLETAERTRPLVTSTVMGVVVLRVAGPVQTGAVAHGSVTRNGRSASESATP